MSQKTEKLLERYCLLILWLSLFPSASCPSSPTQIIWCLGLIVLWRPAPPSIWMLQFTATSSYSPHRLAALGAAWLLLPHPEALEGESCLPDRQHAPWSGAATVYRYDVLEMGLPWMGRAFSASSMVRAEHYPKSHQLCVAVPAGRCQRDLGAQHITVTFSSMPTYICWDCFLWLQFFP